MPRRTLLALMILLPATLVAQQKGKPCSLVFTGVAQGPDTTFMNVFTMADSSRNTFIGGGVDATCEGQGNRLLADSAEHYSARGELILINHVRYSEPRMSMQSDRMVYYTADDRLLATGNVKGKTSTGTRFTGPQIDYFRAKPGVREVPTWRAPGRPFVRMAPSDAGRPEPGAARAGTEADSVDLTADLVISVNDSLVWAVGKVVIERPDLVATADSATMDQGTGFARLMRAPKIVGRGERAFTLVGTVIDLWSREQRLERVLARGKASIISDSLTLTGDTIDLRMKDQRMERAFTWGGRATADAPAQQMEADSLDILMPGQRLQELHAVGRAITYSLVDSTKILSHERDWIAGDTLIARFDTAVTGDTSSSARMRDVVATGNAKSFYQLAPSSGTKGLPNLSYNRGRQITVAFKEGEVEQVTVHDQASGIFLEPTPPADSTRKTPPTPPVKRP